jgi:hypothetical protein
MKLRLLAGAAAALCLLATGPAVAQHIGPDHSVRLRLGMFFPEGEGRYFEEKQDDFTGEGSDLEDVVGGGDYMYRAGRHFGFMLSGDFYEGHTDQQYIDFEDNFGDAIEHTTTLEIASFTAGIFVPLAPEGFPIVPYIGGGGGVYTYRLEESGDFIDFGGRDLEIFSATLEAEGSVLGYYLLAGVEVPVGPYFAFFAEGRWDQAEDDLGDDFEDFGTIDLSGHKLMGGVTWSF